MSSRPAASVTIPAALVVSVRSQVTCRLRLAVARATVATVC